MVSAEEPRVYEGIWRAKNRARQEGWERGQSWSQEQGAINQMKRWGRKLFGRCGRRGTVLSLVGIGPPGGNTGETPGNGLR